MGTKTTTHTPGDLNEFVHEVFASLVRKDQRAASSNYLQGLMLEGRRRSMQPMAKRLGIDRQRLQQFVSSVPWTIEPLRNTLAPRAITLITPTALAIDDTRFVKDSHASPRVARQYSATSEEERAQIPADIGHH